MSKDKGMRSKTHPVQVDCDSGAKQVSPAIPLPRVEKKPSFELRTNKEGHAVIIIRENGNESAAVLDNQQCKALARNLRGIANANGLNNKKR